MVKKQGRVSRVGVMHNQFFGMILIAVGIGALIVMIRYLVVEIGRAHV